LLSAPAGNGTFPTLSLQSLHRCLDPYPAAFSRCLCSFLPGRLRPHVREQTFGTVWDFPAMQLLQGKLFEAAVIHFRFKLLCSLGLPVAPTPESISLQGSQAVYTTHGSCGYPIMSCGIATCPTRAIDRVGLSPTGLQPCRPLRSPSSRARCFRACTGSQTAQRFRQSRISTVKLLPSV